MEIPAQLWDALERAYPTLTARQRTNKAREIIFRHCLDQLTEPVVKIPDIEWDDHPVVVVTDPDGTPLEQSRVYADRIAELAPAIDDMNWFLIADNVERAIEKDRWDADVQARLIETLNQPFDNARNNERVQNHRIRGFFARLLR